MRRERGSAGSRRYERRRRRGLATRRPAKGFFRPWRRAAPRRPQRNRIALVTANLGGIDTIKAIPQHPRIDTYLVTDTENARASPAGQTWTRVLSPLSFDREQPARRRAKYYKVQIHRLRLARAYRWLAWADASLMFSNLDFLVAAVDQLEQRAKRGRLLLVPHPRRRTVREEYRHICKAIAAGNKDLAVRYSPTAMAEQMSWLAAHGLNLDGRLWALGFFVVENNPRINACWNAWWLQIQRFGGMDQIPLPPLIEAFGLLPNELNVNIFDNEHFRFVAHAKLM